MINMSHRKGQLTAIFITVIVLSALRSPLTTYAATDGNIHGTVLDIAGNPLYNVKVTAYTSSGGLETSTTTNEEGYFRMSLGGTYTLIFEKEGYVSLNRNVKVDVAPTDNPKLDAVKMGDLYMEKTVQLSATVLTRYASPGSTLRLSFNIDNKGDQAEDIMFLVESPVNWSTRLLDSIGEIESIRLSPGSQTYTLEITVPSTANETESVELIAVSSLEAALNFTIIPRTTSQQIQLKSTYLSISEEVGKSITLPLRVSNIGEVDKFVTLEGIASNGWSITFKTSSGMVVNSLQLSTGDTESLNINVEPPKDTPVGDYSFIVNVVDSNGNNCDSLEFKVNLRSATSELEVLSTFTDVSISAGSGVTFPIAIWNTGEKDALCLLTVPTAPDNWKTVFISENIEVSSLLITAGESVTVQLKVTPPNSVETGDYQLLASVSSDEGTQTTLPFNINVSGSYNLGLELSTLYKTVTIGNTLSYTATVTNQGQSPVTTIYLDATVPTDWEVTISPPQVTSLNPRSSTTFTIDVKTPSDTVAGDYLLTMQASSDQLDSSEIDLRVTAQTSNTWGFLGFGLIGVVLVGVYFGFKRFKRR
jgi:uncharacterized repeat protein (TIGR01451 family)